MTAPYQPAGTTTASGTYGVTGPPEDASVGQMFAEVSKDLSTLIRQEVQLAKAETTAVAKDAGKSAGLYGGAGVAGHFTLLFLSLALWWALGVLLGDADSPSLAWAGLIVAVIWGIIAAVLAALGKKAMPQDKGLPQTAATIKKIPDALKGQETS